MGQRGPKNKQNMNTNNSENQPTATATPRTDAMLDGCEWGNRQDQAHTVLCRTLERELSSAQAALAAAKAEVARLKVHEGDLVIGAAILEGARQQEAREVDQLRAEVAELREDKARLDWWQGLNAGEAAYIIDAIHGFPDIRAAIDAARKGQP